MRAGRYIRKAVVFKHVESITNAKVLANKYIGVDAKIHQLVGPEHGTYAPLVGKNKVQLYVRKHRLIWAVLHAYCRSQINVPR